MRFYTAQHQYYGGIDLHARRMYICVLDAEGKVRVHRNGPATPEHFLNVIAPYRESLVVAVECIFTWYWVADLCAHEGIPFVLGHALYMKAIHGGKAKNDKIDAHKIAVLLRGGMLPMAYAYPRAMRATRDLLRRRCHFMRKRAELLTHTQNTASQYLLPPFGKKIAYHGNRTDVAERFADPEVRKSIETNLTLLDHYDRLLTDLELHLTRTAKVQDVNAFYRLRPCRHLQANAGPPAAVFCSATSRRIPSAYPGGHSRGGTPHALNSRSAGLRTPAGPRLSTCV
ncbi:MAG: hypothetical protein DMD83_21260 [Candidatus Rokuibacteriota bacterium]|nr:MAG: hypothetical protein DMD83_21260 [Candidatus Rokubacteria bacterium]